MSAVREETPAASTPSVVDAVLGASRVLVAVAARSLSDTAEEVTLAQYRALVVMASKGPQRVADLAEALDVTPPTATRMCDRLVRKGLLKRRASQRDRREVQLTLSPAGRSLVARVTKRRRREIAKILSGISSKTQLAMVDAFEQLSRAAGEVPDQNWAVGWDL